MAGKKKAKKNSLVENINRRKRAGTSRPRSRSTVSKRAYAAMEAGWPKSRPKRASSAKKRAKPARARGRASG